MIRAAARAGKPGKIFCQVCNTQFYQFALSQISQNLNINVSISVAMNLFGTEF